MNKPVWVIDVYGDTDDIVRGWDLPIHDRKVFGSYQGDIAYILRNHDGQFGLSVFGYGTCSGCDYLKHITYAAEVSGDWSEVVAFSKDKLREVHWENSMEELMAWVNESADNGYNWWSYDTEAIEWLNSHGAKVELPNY